MRYSIDELAELSGLSARTVRYYIAEGLIDRPEGEKRGAHYLPRHLEQLRQVRLWSEAGRSHEEMRALRARPAAGPQASAEAGPAAESWWRLALAAGVELHVQPVRAGLSAAQAQELAQGVRALLRGLRAPVPETLGSDA